MLSKKSIDHAETIRDATTHLNDIKSALPQKVICIIFFFPIKKKNNSFWTVVKDTLRPCHNNNNNVERMEKMQVRLGRYPVTRTACLRDRMRSRWSR